MKLYWSPQTRSTRALWMLEEAGVAYELERVDIQSPKRRNTDEFLEASPMGKVPALVDGEVRMSESAAICLYVADRYAAGTLAPAIDSPARGKFLYWLMYTPAVIEPSMSEKFSGVETNRYRSGWGDFELMIETLERRYRGQDLDTRGHLHGGRRHARFQRGVHAHVRHAARLRRAIRVRGPLPGAASVSARDRDQRQGHFVGAGLVPRSRFEKRSYGRCEWRCSRRATTSARSSSCACSSTSR